MGELKKLFLYSLLTFTLTFALVESQEPAAVGFQQELYLYEGDAADATYHVFRDSIEDLSEWPFFTKKKITKVCTAGAWFFYKEANFTGYVFGNYSHTLDLVNNCQVKAQGGRFPLEESLSVRFIGSKQTGQEAVSFFTEEFFQGREYTTDSKTLSISGIQEPINSIVFTGYTNWTFFEDTNFNGSDRCFENSVSRSLGQSGAITKRPKDIDFYVRNPLTQSRLVSLGSASNNCACKTEEMGIPGGRFDTIDDSDDVVVVEDDEDDAREPENGGPGQNLTPGKKPVQVRQHEFV